MNGAMDVMVDVSTLVTRGSDAARAEARRITASRAERDFAGDGIVSGGKVGHGRRQTAGRRLAQRLAAWARLLPLVPSGGAAP